MSTWIKRKLSHVSNSTNVPNSSIQPTSPSKSPSMIRCEVFKSHWSQIANIICLKEVDLTLIVTNETILRQPRPVIRDDVDAVRNLLQKMIYLLAEEQASGQQLGPILEYLIANSLMNKLFEWYERSGDFKQQIAIDHIKVYEVIISQGERSLLHHRQLVSPMLKLLSSCSEMHSEEVNGHYVLLLNLLCVWISRDPTLLDVFFWSSEDQGKTNFIIFSLLVTFIHREGSIGQQARDALLLCVAMSSANKRIADYIVSTDFCPVLATGLSALYSSLPRQIDIRTEEWHFLRKRDWNRVPALVNFMNSFEFCNSVIEAAESTIGESLMNYIHNGFLVSVFGPALHKPSASEVIVTTAYLNLFLQSITAPALLRCFLRFLLCHRHDNSLIINTLIQRIGSSSKLSAVSLSLFQTLLDLDCEDLMLHLVFRYLIPCQHVLASQRRSICDVDIYSTSAQRFVSLMPLCYKSRGKIDAVPENYLKDNDICSAKHVDSSISNDDASAKTERSHSRSSAGSISSEQSNHSAVISSPSTMAEYGPDHDSQMALRTSYADYLERAGHAIASCRQACENWSEMYDGRHPPMNAPTEIKGLGGTVPTNAPGNSCSPITTNESNDCGRFLTRSGPIPFELEDTPVNPALHALNATYQALNATAQAFNKGPLAVANSREECPRKEDAAAIINSVTENLRTNEWDVQVLPVKSDEDWSPAENHSRPYSLEIGSEVPDNSLELKSVNTNALSPLHSVSLDEFFRSLMQMTSVSEGEIPPEEGEDFPTEGTLDGTNSVENSSAVRQSMEDPDDYGNDSVSVNSSFYEEDLEYTPAEHSTPSLAPLLRAHATPYTGPFLSTLFGKVDQMPSNSLYENLLLTGIISRLSCYPQPLLRSFLLNTHVVFHPEVRSLYQVLAGVRNRIDKYAAMVDDFSELICRAEKYLLARDSSSGEVLDDDLIQEAPMPVPKVKTRSAVLTEVFLRRRRNKHRSSRLDKGGISSFTPRIGVEGQSTFYASSNTALSMQINKQIYDTKTKNVVFACIILREFLKELAAISQEHAVSNN